MKKMIGIALAVCMLFSTASLFAGGSKEPSADKPIELIMWTHEDVNRQRLEEAWAAEYMAQNPHVKISYSVYPSTKIQDLIPTAYAARNAPSIWNMELQKAYRCGKSNVCRQNARSGYRY